MKALQNNFPKSRLSDLLGTSRGFFYYQPNQGVRAQEDAVLCDQIRQIWVKSCQTYGSPRIFDRLQEENIRCGENRIARLMKKIGLRGIGGCRRKNAPEKTNSKHGGRIAPNLLKGRTIDHANQVWATDITYLRCAGKWVYLAAVLDMHLHKIVGWQLSKRMDSDLTCAALERAYEAQQPTGKVIIHSDRGSQYCSDQFIAKVESYGFSRSNSAKGNCYDNAMMESFFGVLKREEIDRYSFDSQAQLRRHLFDYIEGFYNTHRLHSTLGMSVAAFEKQQQLARFSEEEVPHQVTNLQEATCPLQTGTAPEVSTSEYPLHSCSAAELRSVSSDNSNKNQFNFEHN